MKNILLSVLVLLALLVGALALHERSQLASSSESLNAQSARLAGKLWQFQKQFGIQDIAMTVRAAHPSDLENCSCWAFTKPDTGEVRVTAIEDMPPAIPQSEREAFQDRILQHEVMHMVLTQVGVPQDFQDRLIMRLQPSLRKP